jgi:hypothetical protein
VRDQNLRIVREFKSLTPDERARIEQSTFKVAGGG